MTLTTKPENSSIDILKVLNRLAGVVCVDASEQFDYEDHYFRAQLNRYYQALQFILSGLDSETRILDIGNYPGHIQKCLLDLGFDVDGIDINPQHIPDTLLDCRNRTIGADIENEVFSSKVEASYSAILLLEVIEHLHVNPLNLLKEMNSILPDGGRLILSTPNLLSLHNRLNFLSGRQTFEHPLSVYEKLERHGSRGHQRLYSSRELIDLLNVFGFDVDRVMSADDKSPCLDQNLYQGQLPEAFRHDVFRGFWCQTKSKKGRIRRRAELFMNQKFPGLADTIYISALRKRDFSHELMVERLKQADPWLDVGKLDKQNGVNIA